MTQDIFLGEILGAVILAGNSSVLKTTFQMRNIQVLATGVEHEDGQIVMNEDKGNFVKVLDHVDPVAYYHSFAQQLGDEKQSAVLKSFDEQKRRWSLS